jgi:hypothetical protein
VKTEREREREEKKKDEKKRHEKKKTSPPDGCYIPADGYTIT